MSASFSAVAFGATANAGPDQTVPENSTVTLDGSGSTATNGGTLSYDWKQTNGPTVTLSDPSSVRPTFTSPSAGGSNVSLEFQLTVSETSSGGPSGEQAKNSSRDSVRITVFSLNPGGSAPVANAGPDQTVTSLSRVELDGSASFDPEGAKLTYAWQQTAGPAVALSGLRSRRPSFIAPSVFVATTLTFQLSVSDGHSTSTDSVDIAVQPKGGGTPVASAGPDQNATAGQTVTLDGTGSSGEQFAWTQVSGTQVQISQPGAQSKTATFVAPAVTAVTPLTFRIAAIIGNARATDDVTITVSPANAGNKPPVADAGADQQAAPGGTVRLDGSRSADPDQEPLSYRWEQVTGPQVTLSGANAVVATFEAPAVSTPTQLQFRLTVTDASGTSSDLVSVIVSAQAAPAAAPPAANASIDNFSIYPNPFSPEHGQATFEYDLGADCDVRIRIYDLFGALTRDLSAGRGASGGAQGRNRATWDGRNGRGEVVGNGGYVVQIEATDAQGHTVRKTDRLAVVK